jgi:hypothetical protein
MAGDEENARMQALWRISHFERHGVVDGVEIDLRHELLDPKEWGTTTIGNSYLSFRETIGLLIWFPWFGSYDEESIVTMLFGSEKADEIKMQSRLEYARFLLSRRKPDCFVESGDKIYIYRVIKSGFESQFDHLHDIQHRFAFLRIKKPNSKPISVKAPLEFIGHTAMGPANGKNYFSKIVNRICDRFGVNNIHEIEIPEECNSYRESAVIYAGSLARSTKDLRKLADEFPSKESRDAEQTMHLINTSVLLGYLWAKAESEKSMKPFAIEGLRSKEKKAIAGKISGATRRAEAEQGWRPHALELAQKIQAKGQNLSQFDLARAIEDSWSLKIHCPKSQLAPAIRAWQKQGKLAKREPHNR